MRSLQVLLVALLVLSSAPASAQVTCSRAQPGCTPKPRLGYTDEYLATTPERVDGLPRPGCLKGVINPKVRGYCPGARRSPVASPATAGGGGTATTPATGQRGGTAPANGHTGARPSTAARPGTDPGTPATADGSSGPADGGDPTTTASEPPPPPPPPPTLAEAAAMCPAPAASTIGRSPRVRGITGLETHLWASAVQPATATGAIRGYPVECTLTPVRWSFTTGDGGSYTRTGPGGPAPDHVVEHVYNTRNQPGQDYILGLSVTWARTTNIGALPSVTTNDSQPYHVVEVRSVPGG